MMYSQLYQYLILHKKLPVPGIGTFLVDRMSAESDFANKRILPPSYSIILESGSQLPGQSFFKWLSNALGISDREAIFRFNDFAFDLKKQISEGAELKWDGVGNLVGGSAGEIKFTPINTITWNPVAAEKVTRKVAAHMVRVGEEEKTSVEMTDLLSQQEEKKSLWWLVSLALALLAVMFIGWYFSEHGVDISSTANSQKLVPMESAVTYKVLP